MTIGLTRLTRLVPFTASTFASLQKHAPSEDAIAGMIYLAKWLHVQKRMMAKLPDDDDILMEAMSLSLRSDIYVISVDERLLRTEQLHLAHIMHPSLTEWAKRVFQGGDCTVPIKISRTDKGVKIAFIPCIHPVLNGTTLELEFMPEDAPIVTHESALQDESFVRRTIQGVLHAYKVAYNEMNRGARRERRGLNIDTPYWAFRSAIEFVGFPWLEVAPGIIVFLGERGYHVEALVDLERYPIADLSPGNREPIPGKIAHLNLGKPFDDISTMFSDDRGMVASTILSAPALRSIANLVGRAEVRILSPKKYTLEMDPLPELVFDD